MPRMRLTSLGGSLQRSPGPVAGGGSSLPLPKNDNTAIGTAFRLDFRPSGLIAHASVYANLPADKSLPAIDLYG